MVRYEVEPVLKKFSNGKTAGAPSTVRFAFYTASTPSRRIRAESGAK
jgi:hypothetical protein